jgi:hypothetical protein
MRIVCTNCQEELADVTVLVPFSASVQCGSCGATVGHQLLPAPAPDPAPVPPKPGSTAASAI